MEKVSNLSVALDNELIEKFRIALKLNKESEEVALRNIITKYISESFLNATKEITSTKKEQAEDKHYGDYLDPNNSKYGKANKKIPKWAYSKNQNNHKIIKAFFQLEREEGIVYVDDLKKRCSNKNQYPDTFCTDFAGNFASMKSDASNSHGKVFIVENDKVNIWNVIYDVLMSYKDSFI